MASLVSGIQAQYIDLQEQYFILRQSLAPLNLTGWQLARLLLAQVWRDIPTSAKLGLGLLVGVAILLAVDGFLVQPYFQSVRRLGIPRLWPSQGKHAWDYKPMLDEAAEKYPHNPWFFAYSGFEFVVFPSAYVDEIRRLPARTASLVDFLTTVQFGGWRLIGSDDSSSTLHKTASTDLARSIAPLGLARQDTAKRAWEAAAGSSGAGKWATISLIWTVLDIVAKMGATGLVGEPLSRDKRWLTAVKVLPMTVGIGVISSSYFPRLLRPLVATLSYFPAYLVYQYQSYLVRPTVEKAVRDFQNNKKEDKKKTTFVQLIVQRYKPSELSVEQVIKDVITASFESTPTTAASLYWMLTELLIRPDLVEELRGEVVSVLDKNGRLPQTQLHELAKLDSFMRESARVNTFHYLGLSRILREPVQLSIGPRLPKGTIVCVDQYHIHGSPDLYPDPDIFDAFRSYRLRHRPGQETLHQYSSNGPELLTWGDGPQVCPGRVFAGNTIKILLAHLLLDYDIQMPAGAAYKPERLSLPNGSVQPDLSVKFMIRRRKVSG
ncbi:cytochrome P450 [Podospora didyma]|uniref:Cytochrome P450 n=1 Tax=Podospora didyma TaxID=330526 RepID=A0AAE0NP90_9PEZI|nr:cytochrome P450 [Podospora didyma]